MLVYEALADALVKEGVEVIFGVAADDNTDLLMELRGKWGVKMISARNERGAAAMADGYSHVTGKPGICTVTQGPGLTNTATSLVTANRTKSPVITITTESSSGGRYFGKAMDQLNFSESTAGKYFSLRHPNNLAKEIRSVFHYVRSGKGPAVFAMPKDLLINSCINDWQYRSLPASNSETKYSDEDPEAITRAAEILGNSRWPILIIGQGAYFSGAEEEVRSISESTGALLASSILAKSYLADHPYNLGPIGGFASTLARRLLAKTDCVVGIGCSMSAKTTENGTMFPKAKVIQIDVNPDQIGNCVPVTERIVGDARLGLAAINAALMKMRGKQASRWPKNIKEQIATTKAKKTNYTKSRGAFDPRQLVTEMNQILPKNRIVAVDNGAFAPFAIGGMNVPDPVSILPTWSFISVGLGLYQGIGAAIGRPDRHVVVFTGDGGFMMSLEELDTAVRYDIPMTIVVMNDDAFGMEVHLLRLANKPEDIARFVSPDFTKIAEGLGAISIKLRTLTELRAAKKILGKVKHPVFLEVKINGNVLHESLQIYMNSEHNRPNTR